MSLADAPDDDDPDDGDPVPAPNRTAADTLPRGCVNAMAALAPPALNHVANLNLLIENSTATQDRLVLLRSRYPGNLMSYSE